MPEETIYTESGVNPDGEPFCTLRWGENTLQLDPKAARGFALTLLEVAEAAEHDAAVFRFMTEILGVPLANVAGLIASLRTYRADQEAKEVDSEKDPEPSSEKE